MEPEVKKFINVDPKNSYPFPNDGYWHRSCELCGCQFDGPKLAPKCYPCSQIGEQLIFDFAQL